MEESILSDGTVELFQRWEPGGAQGNLDQVFVDGEQYIFAVRLSTEEWEFAAVYARCDSETPVWFEVLGDDWGEWDWSDVEWFVASADFDLPYVG